MEYVRSEDRLKALAGRLAGEPLLAADVEAAGYHRYVDRVCLVQLATRDAVYVVDALALGSLSVLAGPLADPAVEVVVHDADYDLRLLARDFGLTVRGLFDTKVAAQFLGESQIGLASLAEKHLGVRLEKKHQRADWARRPLPRELLEYAAEDVRHLPALRDRLRERLEAAGRLGWAEEEFRLAERVRPEPAADGDPYLRLKGTRDLRPRQLAVLRELWTWRARTAEARDVAPFRVVGNETLVEVARRMPATRAALLGVPGVARSVVDRWGRELLEAVERARALPESELPVRPRGPRRPPPDPEWEARVERLRAARDRVADALGLERGFLMPRSQLEAIARAQPRTAAELAALPEVRGWQVEALGDALLEALHGG